MGSQEMFVVMTPGALQAARAHGFIEAEFTSTLDQGLTSADRHRLGEQLATWGDECEEANRHGVIVGRYDDGSFFLMLVLCSQPELQYRLEEMRDVFRAYFGREPSINTEVSEEEAWTSPMATREIVVAAARELVALDHRARDERVEIAFQVMTS